MGVIKTSILLGYRCNNNCRFCLSQHKKDTVKPLSTKKAKKEIELAAGRNSPVIDFLGGEPTLRKDLPSLIRHARDNNFEQIAITTNGRMLSNRKLAEKLIKAGLNSVIFSIHGNTPGLHDYFTRVKGSYDQLSRGIKNVKEIAFELNKEFLLATNTVILRQNLKVLPKIAENNIKLGSRNLEFIFPDPKGNCWDNFEALVPRLPELIGPVHETIEVGRKHKIRHCVMRYLPLCYMYGNFEYLSEYISKNRLKEQHVGPDVVNFDVEMGRQEVGRVKGPQCAGCKRSKDCEGIFKEYALKRGFEDLVPMP